MEINGFNIEPLQGEAGVHDVSFSPTSVNESLDRVVEIDAVAGDKTARVTLIHEGKREVFMASDGDFILADGGTFNVLKGTPQTELPYDILEYLTFDGTTVFDTGYYGNNLTTIEIKFQRASSSPAMYLFGTTSGSRLTAYLNRSGYWRYGDAYPTFNCNNTTLWEAVVTPTGTTVGNTTRNFSVEAFTTAFTIPVGGYKGSSGVATPHYVGKIYYFRMSIDDVVVVDWIPVRRKSDGAELFWDNVTEQFIEKI